MNATLITHNSLKIVGVSCESIRVKVRRALAGLVRLIGRARTRSPYSVLDLAGSLRIGTPTNTEH